MFSQASGVCFLPRCDSRIFSQVSGETVLPRIFARASGEWALPSRLLLPSAYWLPHGAPNPPRLLVVNVPPLAELLRDDLGLTGVGVGLNRELFESPSREVLDAVLLDGAAYGLA